MKLYIALSLLMLVVSANAIPVADEGNALQRRDVHEGVEKREPLCPHGECY